MTKTKTYIYTVRGTGPFPIDMLRYDQAYPNSETDASTIERSFWSRGLIERATDSRSLPQDVTVRSDYRGPTQPRWESFGWKVTS